VCVEWNPDRFKIIRFGAAIADRVPKIAQAVLLNPLSGATNMSGSTTLNSSILTYLLQTNQHTAYDALSACFAKTSGVEGGLKGGRVPTATSESLVGNGAPVDGIGDIVLWGIGKGGLEDALSNFWVRNVCGLFVVCKI
jgi:hypothetical protein